MLPMTLLQMGETLRLDTDPKAPVLLPATSIELHADFAAELQLAPAIDSAAAIPGGAALPVSGKDLPPAPPVLPAPIETQPATVATASFGVAAIPVATALPSAPVVMVNDRPASTPVPSSVTRPVPLATTTKALPSPGIGPQVSSGDERSVPQQPTQPSLPDKIPQPLAPPQTIATKKPVQIPHGRIETERTAPVQQHKRAPVAGISRVPEPIPRPTPAVMTPATLSLDSVPVSSPIPQRLAPKSAIPAPRREAPLPEPVANNRRPLPGPDSPAPTRPLPQVAPAVTIGPVVAEPQAPAPSAPVAAVPAALNLSVQPAAVPVAEGVAATQPGTTTLQVDTPLRDAAWGDRVGERLLVLASHRLQNAEIRVTPAELGPIRVQLALDDVGLNLSFQAQHAVTREAIEQAMPRLRELFAESGLNLNQSTVSDQGQSAEKGVQQGEKDNAQTHSADRRQNGETGTEGDTGTEAAPVWQIEIGDGRVDTFV